MLKVPREKARCKSFNISHRAQDQMLWRIKFSEIKKIKNKKIRKYYYSSETSLVAAINYSPVTSLSAFSRRNVKKEKKNKEKEGKKR